MSHVKKLLSLSQFLSGVPSVSLTLSCFVVHSTRRFVLSLALCYFVLVFFSPYSVAVALLGDGGGSWSWCFTMRLFGLRLFGFVCFLFLLVSGLVIVALPGLFSCLFYFPLIKF